MTPFSGPDFWFIFPKFYPILRVKIGHYFFKISVFGVRKGP